MVALAKAMEEVPGIQEVDLRDNFVEDAGAAAFASAVQACGCFTIIDIRRNWVTDKGCKALLAAFQHPAALALKKVLIKGNPVPDTTLALFSSAEKKKKKQRKSVINTSSRHSQSKGSSSSKKSKSSKTIVCLYCEDICDRSAGLRCGRCKKAKYCSRECQTGHWKVCIPVFHICIHLWVCVSISVCKTHFAHGAFVHLQQNVHPLRHKHSCAPMHKHQSHTKQCAYPTFVIPVVYDT